MEYMESKMQDYYEAGEAHMDHLLETYNPPCDCFTPDWEDRETYVISSDWKGVVTPSVRRMWCWLTGEQQIILSANFETLSRTVDTLDTLQYHESSTGEDAREMHDIVDHGIEELTKSLKEG